MSTAEGTPCYGRGTLIRTDRGDVPVERLQVGDMLAIASGASRPLRRIGRRFYDHGFAGGRTDILPVMVCAGALDVGVPQRDLCVSPLQALFLDGQLVPAMLLVNGVTILQAAAIDTIDYFHLELDEHDILLAEGAPGESFVGDDSRGMVRNADEVGPLYPQVTPPPLRFCASRLEGGEAVKALRERYAARAGNAAPIVVPAGPKPLHGHLDLVDHGMIRGWACEPGGGVASLRILDNGRTIGIVDANRLRPDLVAAHIGDGCHSFEFVVPGGLDPRKRHVIQVQRFNDQTELDASPFFLDRAVGDVDDAATPQIPPVLAELDAEDGRHGHLDTVERGLIKGWAYNSLEPNNPVAVQIFANGHLLVRAVANAHRADLASAGIGSGRHGFEVDLQAELSLSRRHVLHVRIEGSRRDLLGSPAVIEAADAFDGALETVVTDAVSSLGAGACGRVLSFLLSQADRVRQQMADEEAARGPRDRMRRHRRLMGPHAAALPSARRALVIDERMPSPDRDAGSQALLSHIGSLQELGYAVSFVAMEGFEADGTASRRLRERGVAACGSPVYTSVEDVLRRQAGCFDVVYMHRISAASAYMALARRHMPNARLLYSVADLHHLRLSRQAKAQRRPELLGMSHRVRLEECTAAWQAHAVLTHSPVEADLLRRAVPAARVYEVPWAMAIDDAVGPDFAARAGLVFIGHYGHQPNEDAACWLVETIMPLVWVRDPTIPCLLAGSDITPRIHALGRPGIEIHGHIADLAPVWRRVRLSVAPLRFGAGIKGKVLSSLAAGVPCVMTPLAAEGLMLPPTLRELVAEDAESLAGRICHLHAAAGLHTAARAEGLDLIRRNHGREVVRNALRAAIEGSRASATQSAA